MSYAGAPDLDRAATREYLTVSTYAEAEEVLRRSQEFSISGNKPGVAPYVADHVATLDGRRHLERRRLYRDLFRADGLTRYDVLFAEAIHATLDWYRHDRVDGDGDGAVRFDLIECLRRAYGQVIVDLLGFDIRHTTDDWEAFQADVHAIVEVFASDFAEGDVSAIHENAARAKEHIRETYFRPAYDRRRQLLAEARRAGRDPADELPRDVVSFMVSAQAREPDVYGFDEDSILRECLGFLVGGANNPSAGAAWSLLELEGWLSEHPEDRERLGDRSFLEDVVRESLRLHRTGAPFLSRRALNDVELRSSGLRIPADRWVAIDIPRANRDPDVFGEDAERFNPHRRPRDDHERRYGLAFATGPHVCIARPMMVDDDEKTDRLGLQVDVLQVLLEAGVRLDPDRRPTRASHGGERFAEFPVLFGEPLAARTDAGLRS